MLEGPDPRLACDFLCFSTAIIADWVIAVIVVGLLMVIAALFCFIGLCCACRNSDQKGSCMCVCVCVCVCVGGGREGVKR